MIDKLTYELLKYLYDKQHVEISKVVKNFNTLDNDTLLDIIRNCLKPENKYVVLDSLFNNIRGDNRKSNSQRAKLIEQKFFHFGFSFYDIKILPNGRRAVEEYRDNVSYKWQSWIAIGISIAALVLSIIALSK